MGYCGIIHTLSSDGSDQQLTVQSVSQPHSLSSQSVVSALKVNQHILVWEKVSHRFHVLLLQAHV